MPKPICTKCKKEYSIKFMVMDQIWAKIPDKTQKMCLTCFMDTLSRVDPNLKICLNSFADLSIIGDNNQFGDTLIKYTGRNQRHLVYIPER